MRIVFFGTPELAVASLDALADCFEVTALVCQPDRPKGRGKKLVAPPTRDWAREHGLEVTQPTKLNNGAFEAWLKAQAPDLCALVAYGRILKQPILDVPKHGFLNMHPSLLPKYRGPSPIQTAILNGETETAVTIMKLDAEMDAGDILLQEPMTIEDADTTATLSERLATRGAELMVEAVRLVESGQAFFTPQDDAQATFCGMYTKEDGQIRWADSARSIHNLVRAANPWPTAQCLFKSKPIRILATQSVEVDEDARPGTVIEATKNGVILATGSGGLSIKMLQSPGKRALAIAEFLRGNPIREGDRFEDS